MLGQSFGHVQSAIGSLGHQNPNAATELHTPANLSVSGTVGSESQSPTKLAGDGALYIPVTRQTFGIAIHSTIKGFHIRRLYTAFSTIDSGVVTQWIIKRTVIPMPKARTCQHAGILVSGVLLGLAICSCLYALCDVCLGSDRPERSSLHTLHARMLSA